MVVMAKLVDALDCESGAERRARSYLVNHPNLKFIQVWKENSNMFPSSGSLYELLLLPHSVMAAQLALTQFDIVRFYGRQPVFD